MGHTFVYARYGMEVLAMGWIWIIAGAAILIFSIVEVARHLRRQCRHGCEGCARENCVHRKSNEK